MTRSGTNRLALTTLLLTISLMLALGCHTMRFEVSEEAHAEVIHEPKSFFFWGLVPRKVIDVSQKCPAGVAAIKEETTLLDGLITFPTLGIWGRRSTWYYCLPEEKAE